MKRLDGTATGSLLPLLIILALGACADAGGEPGGVVATGVEFCDRVLPRVEAFMGRQPQASGPRYGGTAVAATIGDIPEGMNVFAASDYNAHQHQIFVNLMTLVRYDDAFQPQPYLADSWTVSEDGSSVTFTLRDDVVWHDGIPTTAHDVAFTFERMRDPETGFPNANYWRYYEDVEVLDSLKVRFTFEPHSEVLDPWRATAIMPRHLLEDVPPGDLATHPFGTICPVGNGPFRFIEHRLDESWTFGRNPAFPDGLGGPPKLSRYVFRVIPDQNTLLTELLTGGIDVLLAVPPDQADDVREASGVRLIHYPFRNFDFIGWNTRRPHLADANVRKALTLGLDRAAMAEALLHGYGRVSNSSVAPFHWAVEPSLADSMPLDPARAAALLTRAGWVDRDGDGIREDAAGTPFTLDIVTNQGNQTRENIVEIAQAQLSEIGVQVEPRILEYGSLIAAITDPEARDFDGLVLGWVAEFKQDDTDLFHSDRIDNPFAFVGLRDPEVDRLLDTLPLIVDREDARPVWRDYQETLLDVHPMTFLWFQERLDGVSERLQGVVMDARGEWVSVQEWWIPENRRR